jgi:uncharacterized membrane protein
MRTRGLFIASLLLAAAMALFGWFAAGQVPAGTELPTHWNAAGEVDRTMPPGRALSIAPIITVLLGCLLAVIPRIEPLQERLAGSAAVLRTTWIGTLGIMALVQLMIGGPALGWQVGPDLVVCSVGLLLVALGNVLPKSRPSFFVGARTPWALTDPDNWVATQRLAGKTMITAGLLILASAFIPLGQTAKGLLILAAALGSGLIPIAYSWWLWQRRAPGG